MLKRSTWWRVRLWLACCAILAGALAPSVSHALAAGRGYTPIAAICSADASYGANEQGWHLLADCDYCLSGVDLFTPPQAHQPVRVDGDPRHAPLFGHAPLPSLCPGAVRVRGPPAP